MEENFFKKHESIILEIALSENITMEEAANILSKIMDKYVIGDKEYSITNMISEEILQILVDDYDDKYNRDIHDMYDEYVDMINS